MKVMHTELQKCTRTHTQLITHVHWLIVRHGKNATGIFVFIVLHVHCFHHSRSATPPVPGRTIVTNCVTRRLHDSIVIMNPSVFVVRISHLPVTQLSMIHSRTHRHHPSFCIWDHTSSSSSSSSSSVIVLPQCSLWCILVAAWIIHSYRPWSFIGRPSPSPMVPSWHHHHHNDLGFFNTRMRIFALFYRICRPRPMTCLGGSPDHDRPDIFAARLARLVPLHLVKVNIDVHVAWLNIQHVIPIYL